MKLRNPLALENMSPNYPASDALDMPSTIGLTTRPAKRYTSRIQAAEERQLLRAESLAQNSYHRNNALDFEAEFYAALKR